jgi:diguanylate cyclase (GGDEF)-like protein/PAS domain S-box-containing protein
MLAGIAVVYFGAMIVVQKLFIEPSFDTLQRNTALHNLDRVMAAVTREAQHLAAFDRGWSAWDDAYAFAEGKDAAYAKDNLSPDLLKPSRISLVAIYDSSGRLLYEQNYDWSTGSASAAGLFPSKAPEGYPLLHGTAGTQDVTGFMHCSRGVYVIASTPILRTDGTGPTRGSFIMGQLIDSAFVSAISAQTSVQTKLLPMDQAAPVDPAAVGTAGGKLLRAGSDSILSAYGVLKDLWGAPALIVQADTLRDISAWARETVRIANAMIYFLGLCFLVILFLQLSRLVVRPLTEIQKIVRAYETDEPAAMPKGIVSRPDEIGRLAQVFQHMGDTIAAKRQELETANDTLEATVAERTRELRKSNEDLRLMAEVVASTAESIVVTDLDGNILRVNPAFCATSGYDEAELIGKNPRIMKSDKHEPAFYKALWGRLTTAGSWSGEIWDRRKSGEIFPKWLAINLIRNEAGEPRNYVGVSSDISNIKDAEERLHQLAYFDPLTGQPNRALFRDRLDRSVARAQRDKTRLGLLFIDLDRFKYVNDAMGHGAGDQLLAEVARRIARRVRNSDTVARLGGDEFTVILEKLRRNEDGGIIAQNIIDELTKPIVLDGKEVYIGASIGIAIYPYDDATAEGLTRMADAAMYRAKTAGRNGFQFVSRQTNANNQARLALETDLRRALERGELILHYQPLVDIDGGRVLGAEALMRWNRRDGELMPPSRFIPLAEETGVILPLGSWALLEACRTATLWHSHGTNLFVSVNVSARQFANAGLSREVGAVLAKSGLPPELLVIELTESTVMADVDTAHRTMTDLKSIGVSIAIDDFGTGYSSLSYLSRFPVDRLKIDQSFIRGIGTGSRADAIVGAIISMADSLGLGTVAEGVETEEQRLFLQGHGCGEAQGYLFSKPAPFEAFAAYMSEKAEALSRLP